MRHSHFAADGRDVDDATFAAMPQVRDGVHHQSERRPEMQIHRALEILAMHVIERANFDDACVVDDDIEAAEIIDDLLNGGVNLRAIQQIA